MKRLLHALIVMAVCSALTPLAMAKDHERWHERDGDHDREHRFHRVRDYRDHDGDRDRDHERYRRGEWREHDRDHRPYGWDRGRKRGWDDDDRPPGQTKYHPRRQPPVIIGNRQPHQPPFIAGNRQPHQPPIIAGNRQPHQAPIIAGNRAPRARDNDRDRR